MTLRKVSRSYVTGIDIVVAVQDASLEVRCGEFACVLGASGSGKTTLLNLIAGLDRPDTGSIQVNGSELTRLSDRSLAQLRLSEVGVVFQDHNLIEEFTAVENVMLPLEVAGMPSGEARRLAQAELDKVGLSGLGDRFPARLSGGQKQRVGIARALVGDRHVLLADEPTGALDSTNSRALFAVMRRLCSDGACVLLATHDPLAQEYVDTVYEMTDGRLARAR